MEKIVFECELVTPMFMYGADGKTLELRPSSIKGIMRFWWRAVNGNLSLDELRKQENDIFGSMDKKSSFSMRISSNNLHSKKLDKGSKFNIEIFKFRDNFDIEKFFTLVSYLALFGRKGKGDYKTQGSLKIIKINDIDYKKDINLKNLYEYLELFTTNYRLNQNNIARISIKEKYPQIKNISIDRNNNLYINFENSKFKTIQKKVGDYNANE